MDISETENTVKEEKETVTPDPQAVQRQLYYYVDELKRMHSEIPEVYQLRISYDLLTQIANSLLNESVFDILNGLIDIQHATEDNLAKLRQDLLENQQQEIEEWQNKIKDPEELQHILELLKIKHEKDITETDKKIIALLDAKVNEQQSIMQKAGVAGFYVTNQPKEIKIQMFLMDFILRLSKTVTERKQKKPIE